VAYIRDYVRSDGYLGTCDAMATATSEAAAGVRLTVMKLQTTSRQETLRIQIVQHAVLFKFMSRGIRM
jgi:hypothetical protein